METRNPGSAPSLPFFASPNDEELTAMHASIANTKSYADAVVTRQTDLVQDAAKLDTRNTSTVVAEFGDTVTREALRDAVRTALKTDAYNIEVWIPASAVDHSLMDSESFTLSGTATKGTPHQIVFAKFTRRIRR